MKPLREPHCGNWIGHWKVNLITPESSTRDVRLHLISNALILWKRSGHKAVLTHVSPALCMCLIACRFNSGRYGRSTTVTQVVCDARIGRIFCSKRSGKKVQLGVFVLLARGSIDGFRIKQMILNRNGSAPRTQPHASQDYSIWGGSFFFERWLKMFTPTIIELNPTYLCSFKYFDSRNRFMWNHTITFVYYFPWSTMVKKKTTTTF